MALSCNITYLCSQKGTKPTFKNLNFSKMKQVFQTMTFQMLTAYVADLTSFIALYGEQSGRTKRMLNIALKVLANWNK